MGEMTKMKQELAQVKTERDFFKYQFESAQMEIRRLKEELDEIKIKIAKMK